MADSVLCVDIGTTSLKVAVISGNGDVCAYTRQKIDYSIDSGIWLKALASAISTLKANDSIDYGCVKSLCISGNGPTIVSQTYGGFIHGGSEKILLWNECLSDRQFYQKENGMDFHISSNRSPCDCCDSKSLFLPRLELFRNLYPAIWDESSQVFSGPEYLIYQLTDYALTILPEERFRSAYWTPNCLAKASIPQLKLPAFVPPAFCAGALTADAVKFLKLEKSSIKFDNKVYVYCGAPDFIAALIGTGTLYPGTACDRAGSSEGINLCTQKPVSVQGIRLLPSIIPPFYNASVLIPDSGSSFSSFKKSQPDGNDVPYPAFVADLLDSPKSKGYKLIMDIMFRVKAAFQKLDSYASLAAGTRIKTVRVAGGQSKNPVWMQLKADVLGLPIEVTSCPDAELIGDAVLAHVGTGEFQTIRQASEKFVGIKVVYKPNELKVEQYAREFAKSEYSRLEFIENRVNLQSKFPNLISGGL